MSDSHNGDEEIADAKGSELLGGFIVLGKQRFLVLYFIWSNVALGETPTDIVPDALTETEVVHLEKYGERTIKDGLSVLPVAGANSTFGFMGGAAAVYYKPLEFYHKVLAVVIATTKGQKLWALQHEAKRRPLYGGMDIQFSDFFEPYYGETKVIRPEKPDEVQVDRYQFKPYLAWMLGGDWLVRGFLQEKFRKEAERMVLHTGETIERRIHPDERTRVIGLHFSYDNRRESNYSQLGTYGALEVIHMPGGPATTIIGQKPFTRGTLDYRRYIALHPKWTLAGRLKVGTSLGEPTAAYQFHLGGSETLRAFGENRFAGSRYYLVQSELRYHIWKIVSGGTFVEFGDVTFDDFGKPIPSYGTGFRVGLPPDYVAKVRLDFGFGREGMNVSAQANHAF